MVDLHRDTRSPEKKKRPLFQGRRGRVSGVFSSYSDRFHMTERFSKSVCFKTFLCWT